MTAENLASAPKDKPQPPLDEDTRTTCGLLTDD